MQKEIKLVTKVDFNCFVPVRKLKVVKDNNFVNLKNCI